MQSFTQRSAKRMLLRLLEVAAWTLFFAFAALFLALRFWVLPQVERYQVEIESALARAVGLPVTVGAVRADWDGLRPRLVARDVRVLDLAGREALLLPSVEPVIGWSTLLARDLRLYSLTIDGPRLTVRRGTDGVLAVAGVALGTGGGAADGTSAGGRLPDWILEQREIIVRNAHIEWIDDKRAAPPLVLRDLQLRLRNRGELHQIGLSARPPRALGAALELRASLIGRGVARVEDWNGRVYAELGYTDLAGWRAWVDYPIEVESGQGALRLWATFGAGKLVDATADLALAGVAARLAGELPMLRVARVAGRVQGRATERGYEFGARGLALQPVEGAAMHGTSFRASWEAGTPPRGTLSADLIELAPLAQLAEYLPFPADLRALLADMAPEGRIRDASFEWEGELPQAARYSARTRFEALSMNAWRGIPGFSNLSGRIEATEGGGALHLASSGAALALPRVFADPRVALDTLGGALQWDWGEAGAVTVRATDLAFANGDLAGTASGTYAHLGDGPGHLDLSARLQRANARSLERYLPRPGLMGPVTRAWLVASIRGGESTDVRLRLRGDLRHMPFKDPQQGLFQVVAQVRNAEVAYAPGWPAITGIDAELRFERDQMDIALHRGTILGASIARASLGMRLENPGVLQVDGEMHGPSNAFLDFIGQSPLRARLGEFTEGARVAGEGALRIKMRLPLVEMSRSEIEGQFSFSGNALRLQGRMPPIEQAAGVLAFTQSSVQLRNATARFAGGPLRILGGSQRDGSVALSVGGRFVMAELEPQLPKAWRGRLQGASSYAGSIRLQRGSPPQVALESNLVGVSSTLPAPLAKSGPDQQLLHVSLLKGRDGARDRVSVTLGRLLRAEFLRNRSDADGEADRVAIGFHLPPGERLRLPQRPVSTLLYGSLPHLDFDSWRALLAGEAGGGAGETAVEMSFGQLDAFNRRLEDISIKARVGSGGWNAAVVSKEIAGDLEYRGGARPALLARMARFAVPAEAPASRGEAGRDELPDLDLVAEDFGFRGHRLGRLELKAQHAGLDWNIERLSMRSPDGELSGTGRWRTGPAPTTTLKLDLALADAGRFLQRVGQPRLVEGGQAKMTAALAWNGAPTELDYSSLSGTLQLHATDGRFVEIDPGMGKLISLMSLQMLPRRAVLDFSDVFSEGFEWASIDATARIEQGVLETRDFRMSGTGAEVAIQGQVDLDAETQDLRVRVVPGLDGTTATVAGVLINPAIGLGTLLAQKLLKNPLGQIFAFEYGVSGPWTDPKVVKIATTNVPVKTPDGD
jgi:uncharacterized protein (TIGR02099 family)